MAATAIVPGLWEVSLGFVNAFVLESPAGLAVIDTGVAGAPASCSRPSRSWGGSRPTCGICWSRIATATMPAAWPS